MLSIYMSKWHVDISIFQNKNIKEHTEILLNNGDLKVTIILEWWVTCNDYEDQTRYSCVYSCVYATMIGSNMTGK